MAERVFKCSECGGPAHRGYLAGIPLIVCDDEWECRNLGGLMSFPAALLTLPIVLFIDLLVIVPGEEDRKGLRGWWDCLKESFDGE